MIKDEVGSVEGFGGKAQERRLLFGIRIGHERGQGLKLRERRSGCKNLVKKNYYSLALK